MPDLQVRPGGLQTWLILFRIKFSSVWVGRWWQRSEGIDSKLQRGKKEKINEVSVLEETNKEPVINTISLVTQCKYKEVERGMIS